MMRAESWMYMKEQRTILLKKITLSLLIDKETLLITLSHGIDQSSHKAGTM